MYPEVGDLIPDQHHALAAVLFQEQEKLHARLERLMVDHEKMDVRMANQLIGIAKKNAMAAERLPIHHHQSDDTNMILHLLNALLIQNAAAPNPLADMAEEVVLPSHVRVLIPIAIIEQKSSSSIYKVNI